MHYSTLIAFLLAHGFKLALILFALISSLHKKQKKKQREWQSKAPPQSAALPEGMPSMATTNKSSFGRPADSSATSSSNLTGAGRTSRIQTPNSPWSPDADPFGTKRENR